MRVVMLAPPGAGKGTQGTLIARHFDLPHVALGDLLRVHMSRRTPVGERVREYVMAGELVPDELVLELVVHGLRGTSDRGGYVLDGFPRSIPQARQADHILTELGLAPQVVLHLAVDDDEVVRRLLARGSLENRLDDNEITIRRRLDVYHTVTAPVLDYYAANSRLVSVDAMQSVDAVGEDVLDALETLNPDVTRLPAAGDVLESCG